MPIFSDDRFAKFRDKVVCLFTAAAFSVAALPVDGFAQQLPTGVTPEQVQQLQQQYGQAAGVSAGSVQQNPALQNPSPVILQPAVPPTSAENGASRLEQILSARAGVRLQQFGYDQFGHGAAVTVPQTGAVQDDYILGPGDEIVVSLRGQENSEFRVTVDRNGQIVLPRLSPIPASGRNFGSLRLDIQNAVHRTYVATEAFVSVGRMRQISVMVSGEVVNPGQRLVTGLSSAVDALMLSGGVRKTGSLRNIRIQRGGHEYNIDLYGFLTSGSARETMRLADGDRIIVPPLGRTVAVTGLVRQPGIFELPPGASSISARALLGLAGGQEVRGRYRLSVMRILPDGRTSLETLGAESSPVHDSEILFVQIGADQTISSATLSGGTGLAGNYPIVQGTRLSDILKAPGALGPAPYTLFGIIVRRDPRTLIRSLVAFSPVAVLAGTQDLTLQTDDIVRVFSLNEEQLLDFLVKSYLQNLANAQRAIRNPIGSSLEDSQNVARGLEVQTESPVESVTGVSAEIQEREIIKLLDTAVPGSEFARQQLSRRQAQQTIQSQQLQQKTTSTVPSSMAPESFANRLPVAETGESTVATGLPNTDPARNFTDQDVTNDQFASNREVWNFGQLVRQLGVNPLVLVNFLIDHRARIDGAVRGPGYYFIGPQVKLDVFVEAAGGTVDWADESGVELISSTVDRSSGQSLTRRVSLPLHETTLANYVVQPHDLLRFRQTFSDVGLGTVTVQGEVRNAGTFALVRGEHLSDLLARAGGLTSAAYPYGTVFLRQSAAQAEREGYIRAAKEIEDQLVIAMTHIGNDKIEPGTFASLQTFVTELRNQKAIGRISIVADPAQLAANPSLDPLLEPGDMVYIPQRPSTVSVMGQVLQPGSYPYKPDARVGDYIQRAGGYARTADESQTFVVLPDGAARKIERSWLSFDAASLPPGSTIMVPRDMTPLDLRQTIIDVSQIFSQFAISIASVAVLAKQ